MKDVNVYYFSPTGGTKKVALAFANAIAENVKEYDWGKNTENAAEEAELVIVAAPVFGGRIPAFAADKMNHLNGNGKKAMTLAVFGNRAYEDALLEMNDIMTERGFSVIASAACNAQHSVVNAVAKGRPDAEDVKEIQEFAAKVLIKLENAEESKPEVPGNHPYKEAMAVPATPISLEAGTKCGKCALVCPTQAITVADVVMTEPEKCMLCMACVAACPVGARILPSPVQAVMDEKLGALVNVRTANEFFL